MAVYTQQRAEGGPGVGPGVTTYINTYNPDLPGIQSAVSELLGMQGQQFQYTAGIAAQAAALKGDTAAAEAYGQAQTIAEQNAALAGIATKITQAQTEREVRKTIGTQTAQIGSAGLRNSGSALSLMRSSVQQGTLASQLEGTQGAITQNGFLSQAVIAGGEKDAANAAAEAAKNLGSIYQTASTTTQANIDAETKALMGYTKLTGATNNPDAQLLLSTLTGTPGTAGTLPSSFSFSPFPGMHSPNQFSPPIEGAMPSFETSIPTNPLSSVIQNNA